MDGSDTAKKVAFCSALFAGFAYFSLSILRDAFRGNGKKKSAETNGTSKNTKTEKGRRGSEADGVCNGYVVSPLSNASSQTDLTLPVGTREKLTAWHNIPPELWAPWAKSIQERIRDLNLRMVGERYTWRKQGVGHGSALLPSMSLQNTPKHSPRTQSPDLRRQSNLSRSAESLNHGSAYNEVLTKSSSASRSQVGLHRVLHCPSDTEIAMYSRTLDKLYGKPNPNLSQQEASVLTLLLLSRDDDLLIRTLSVIANCAAFTANIDPICDSGCTIILCELLDHSSPGVQTVATQAIANIAISERAQELVKPCIPFLVKNVSESSDLQLNWTLIALSNLALKDSNHGEMTGSVLHSAMNLVTYGTPGVKLQALRLLINLSSNADMVPHLLAARAPPKLCALLDPKSDGDFLLRLTNLLANVVETTCHRDIRPQDLPSSNKAPSPETLYSALFGFEVAEILVQKLNLLSSVPHEDIRHQVNRILKKVR